MATCSPLCPKSRGNTFMTSSSFNPATLYVKSHGGEFVALSADRDGSLKTIQPNEFRVHEGVGFTAGFFWDSTNKLVAGGTASMLIQPAVDSHIVALISSDAGFDLFFYKSTTFSAVGTVVGNINKNQVSTNTSAMVISHSPTITDNGSLLGGLVIPNGGLFGGGGGSAGAFGSEFIIPAGDKYLLTALNDSGGDAEISVSFEWYETG